MCNSQFLWDIFMWLCLWLQSKGRRKRNCHLSITITEAKCASNFRGLYFLWVVYHSDLYLIVGYYTSSPKFRSVVHPDKLLTCISCDYFSLYRESGALESISPSKQLSVCLTEQACSYGCYLKVCIFSKPRWMSKSAVAKGSPVTSGYDSAVVIDIFSCFSLHEMLFSPFGPTAKQGLPQSLLESIP